MSNTRKRGGRKSKQLPISKNQDQPAEGSLEKLINDPELLKSLPEDEQRKMVRLASLSVEQRFSGPIPPPSILEGYNSALENGAERIMRMAEKQLDHRISLEDKVITNQLKESSKGQWFGFIIGIFALTLAGGLAYTGHEIAGSIIGAAGVTGLVSVFVLGKRMQKRELSEK